ncbi:anti-sigma factor family protein [Martelella soudanensis]|uniref:anti-sigma factor family protein n=1 Tax=unclassified Martelella TaxID=2629616 RepID=UPI0015DFBCAE|nr:MULTISPECIES: zf-HC2 domain-containing protein [unclassified Martelella]
MLRCSEVAQRASLLIDGELGPLQRLNIKLHLAMCRGCRAFVAQMRITRDLTRTASGSEEQHIDPEIQAALAQRRPRPVGRI